MIDQEIEKLIEWRFVDNHIWSDYIGSHTLHGQIKAGNKMRGESVILVQVPESDMPAAKAGGKRRITKDLIAWFKTIR